MLSAQTAISGSVLLILSGMAVAGDINWPQFRGPDASGVADGYKRPTEWDVSAGKNVKWKTAIPGLGHSSPVIWGDRVFVTTAVSSKGESFLKVGLYGESPDNPEQYEHDYRVYCLEKKSGKVLWERSAYQGVPKVKRHIKASHANPTPATDGKHLVVSFGSEGLYCYDLDGKLLWERDLGILDSGPVEVADLQWGYASSPVIHDGRVLVQVDVRGPSYIAALDVETGNDIWRTPRSDNPTWSTPTVVKSESRTQVVCNGYKHVAGYDFETGKELWHLSGGGDVPVPTPVLGHDLLFITNAHGGDAPVYAIRTNASGDISLHDGAASNEHIQWAQMRIGNYMQTPLVYGDLLYCCRDSGIVSVYDARTGKKQYRARLAGGMGFTASPVAADGKVYFTSEEGDVFVIKAGPEHELLAQNDLGEISMASPAISEGVLYFRTQGHLTLQR